VSLPVFRLGSMEQAGEVRRLRAACESVGFFYVAEHGVDPGLERRLEADSAAFFALPVADKQRIAMARGGAAWRGYFPVRGELTSGVPDVKEGLYFGEELAPDDPRAGWPMHGTSLFPDEPRGLREVVPAYMQAQVEVGQRVLRALALALDLDPAYFLTHLTYRPTSLFRIFHYPATTDAAEGRRRAHRLRPPDAAQAG
jgi:isopenicillin N synthase-like dioxygenase